MPSDFMNLQESIQIDKIDEILTAVELLSQCGGRCPNCMEKILPDKNFKHMAS